MPIVIRNKQCIRANRAYNQRGNRHLASPRAYCHPVAFPDTQPCSSLLMDFHPGIGCSLIQKWSTPCLVAREIVIDDAASRQNQRILIVWLLSRWNVGDWMKTCLAIREAETLLVETRRARVILGGARPEDTVLLLDLLVGDSPIIRFRSPGTETQFIENVSR